VQRQIETANRNSERIKLAAELETLQSAMSTDLSALRERREARKASAAAAAPWKATASVAATSDGYKCPSCGDTFQLVSSLRLHESRCGRKLDQSPVQVSIAQQATDSWSAALSEPAPTAPARYSPQQEPSSPKHTPFTGVTPSPSRSPPRKELSASRERSYHASPVSQFAASTASVEVSTPTIAPSTMIIDTPMGKVVVPIGTDAAGAVAALRAQQAMQQSPFSAASESTFATQASTTRASPDRDPLSPATVSSSASTNHYSPFTSAAAYSPFTSPAATITSPASGSPASMGRHQSRSPMRQSSPSRQGSTRTKASTPAPPQPPIAQVFAVLPSPKPWPTHQVRPKPFWRGGVPVRGHVAHAKNSPLLTGGRVVQSLDTTKAWQCPNCKTSNTCEVDCSVAHRDVMSFGLSNRVALNGPPTHAEVCSAISIDEYQPFASWRYHIRCSQCLWQEFSSGGGLASTAPTIKA